MTCLTCLFLVNYFMDDWKNDPQNIFRKEYRLLSDEEKAMIANLKDIAGNLYTAIVNTPGGRENSLAITKLEEAVMWAVKGITG